jgi:hypothetical protein
MKPRYLVYILTAIIVAFVIKGYTCAEEMKCSLQCIEEGGIKSIDFNNLRASVDGFKNQMFLSGVLAVVIATCCGLKAPR